MRGLVLGAASLLFLVHGPESARIVAQRPSDVEGIIEVHYEDSYSGPRLKYYLDTGTEHLELAFARSRPQHLTTGRRVHARGVRRNAVLMLEAADDVSGLGGTVSSVSPTPSLASPYTFGVQQTLVILFNFADLPSQPYTTATANSVTFTQANDFFLENSFQQTSLQGTVVGWYTIASPSTVCNYNVWAAQAEAKAQEAGVNLSLYPRHVFGFPQTSACSWWGLGSIGGGDPGNPSRAWINGTYSLRVVAHEMGHNFGLYHSHSNTCDTVNGCFVDEYGDDHDVMGGGASSITGHFNAFQKDRLGWLNYGVSPTITTVGGSGQYTLEPYAKPWSGAPKALKILKSTSGESNTYIYAEARTRTGIDSNLTPGVIIHTGVDNDGNQSFEEDVQPASGATDFILDPGQSVTFSDAVPQVTISTISSGGSGATIAITQACAYSLTPTGQAFGDAGGSGSVALTTGTSCAWTATSDSPWLTVNGGSASGTGPGTIQFALAPNVGPARTGTLTIGGQPFIVSQAAESCVYAVSPLNPDVNYTGPSAYTVNVTATPSNCAWTAASNAPWITITDGASGVGDGTVTYQVSSNSASHTSRSGTMFVATQTVTVVQEGLSALFAIPVDGATNVKTSSTFLWSPITGVQSYTLLVGTTFGSSDLLNTGPITQNSVPVNNLPASRQLYAHLRTTWDATTATTQDISFTTVDRVNGLQLLGAQSPNPITAGASAQYGANAGNSVKLSFTGALGSCTATFSATGLPTGATATFSPASATSSATSQYTLMTVATTAGTIPGNYTFNVRAVESSACGGATTTVTAPLVVLSTTSVAPTTATGTYGGSASVSALLTYGGSPVSGKTLSFTLNGRAVGSATTDGSGVATLASASLTGIAAGSYPTGVSASFAGDASYGASSGTSLLTVSQKPVTPTVVAANKVYDGTPSATLTSCSLTGVIAGDVLACSGIGTFASASVGTGKPVVASAITLSGAAAVNYLLSSTTAATTAAITARSVVPAVTAADKVYDGTTAATLTSCTVSVVIAGDVVGCTGTATFASATVGTGKVVTATGLTLTGVSAPNYVLTTTTATTTASINAAVGPAPVAAYAFNDGSGTTTADSSGTGNRGNITGATWTTAGKYGGALAFNGSSAIVTIPDAPSLHLSTAMTLEAWINPSTVTGEWEDVLYKGDDNFYLEAMWPGRAGPLAGGTWAANLNLAAPAAIALNTWTHIASTYDGAMLRLYVNGTQVASSARTGSLVSSAYPLQIGGDSIYGQYFAGLIDDVRVYNVALTAAQIQSDMNTPVGATAATPDLTVTKTHAGTFTQGQAGATYSVTVRNAGTGATSGLVTVADAVPSGLTATGLAGSGWSCTVATATCTRSDALAAGASYPAVTVTVNVASAAPPAVTNQVTASGGGDTTPANNSASDLTTIVPALAGTTLSAAAANGIYGGTSAVSATLSAAGLPISGKTVAFTLQGAAVGTAVTNASGVATLASASLTGISAGSYPSGVSASFAGDASYGASSGAGSLTVSQKPVTPAITATAKVYDGTTSATLTSCTLTGAVGGDVVSCVGTATFASTSVGTGKTVTANGLALSGAAAPNYTLTSTTATTTAAITARPVTPAVTVADKVYDATPAATLTSCTPTGVIGGDVVACTGTATFASSSVGTGKTVNTNGIVLSGAAATNYTLASTTAATTAAITARPVTPAVTIADKVYDGTPTATITSCTLTGVISGDVVGCTGTATFTYVGAGLGKPVTATGIVLNGASAGNYALSATTATATANITPATVTPAVTAANKAYDGTPSATLTSCTPAGVLTGDVVTCAGTSASFASASVGTGKTVTANGIALSGAAAGNYALSATTATTTANITAASVTPTVTAADKVYDGTPAATLTSCTVTGALAGDVVGCAGTATFTWVSVGAGTPVTANGITLSGAAAGNYALSTTTATTTANITPAMVTPAVTAANKAYDGTASATLTSCTPAGVFNGDVVTCTGTATFASASVGTGKTVTANGIALSGAAAGNYALSGTTATTTASITAASVTPAVTAANKVYDGTPAATLTSCTVTGAIAGDVVGCTGTATFTWVSVGNGMPVTANGITLSGAAAGNYVLSSTTATTTANITPVLVTPAVTAANKVYDGTPAATLTSCSPAGVLSGDVVTCAGTATFASAGVGTGKTVTASGITLAGAAAGNYALSTTTATATANITAAMVTPAVTAANKVYDGTPAATLTSCTPAGVVGGDVVTCTGTVSFASAGVGTGKTVTANGIALSGAAAANYALSATTATTTANITAAVLTPAVTAANKVYDGTAVATVTGCTLTGVIGGDVVGCSATATFASAYVGIGKTVNASGIALTGSAAANYTLAATTAVTSAAITARSVAPAVTAADKVYDGTTTATLTSCTLSGIITGDVVGCTGTAAFASPSVGTGKVVTVTGLTLTGVSAPNYVLTTTTATTTASINAAVGPAPVAAYAFNDGSGTTTADSSGTGNRGNITGATWTTGKYGGALAFDGSSAMVTIPDAPSLHLSTAMTLEAWIKPSAVTGDWADVIYKGNDIYYLEAMWPERAGPLVGGTWAANMNLDGPGTLALNTWTHIAATYDGAMLRLYVNGTQVASAPRSGPLSSSANPLQIGGDSIYGQYFAGLIDDVRVYNVALTAAQIQADMNTPVAP